MDNRLADMHRGAGLADRHLVGADQLRRERVLDAAVGVGDVHAPSRCQISSGPSFTPRTAHGGRSQPGISMPFSGMLLKKA